MQVMLLEELEFSPETEAMWQTLCTQTLHPKPLEPKHETLNPHHTSTTKNAKS
jgi:hypothetical protein